MPYDPFDEEPAENESPDDKDLNELIDLWLSDDRPDRYQASEKEWMDVVVERATKALQGRPDKDGVIQDIARRRVYQREGQATRRANKVLRDIGDTGQLPLGWDDEELWREMLYEKLRLPLSIEQQRVRLGAASPADLESWKTTNKREEEKRNAAQEAARQGADLLARWVREQHVLRVEDLRAP